MDGDCEGFKSEAHEEARGILQKDASLERFVEEIGWVYRNRAEWYLARLASRFGALGFRALYLRMWRRGREARQMANTAKLGVSSFMKLRKIVNESDDTDNPTQEAGNELPSSLTNALPTFMETFWSFSSHDITGTLDKVIERVLSDTTLSMADRRKRAQGLWALGEAFVEEAQRSRASEQQSSGSSSGGSRGQGNGEGGEAERKRRRFEEAFMASMAGADH